ncbi:MAG TPA: CrcB family protein, partial [Pirellulales bacterium]|nr:CrcB family protein [Pirellulales bacterium]
GGEWFTRDHLRLLFAVGLAGGYTTFSSFEWESYDLIRDNQSLFGTIYVVGSVVVGLIALRIGVALGRI